MLTDKLSLVPVEDSAQEDVDFFEECLFSIFADAQNQHGEPGQHVIYKSSAHGDINLRLCNPDPGDNGLFSHFLWNAGVQAADMITDAKEFDVRGKRVLEMGAGAGLPGLVSALEGASEVVLSDYPAEKILDNLRQNVKKNLSEKNLPETTTVVGHKWGETDEIFDNWGKAAGKTFDRIIAADCMWMDWQHDNLCNSIQRLLSDDGVCLAIAGFHTGRPKVASFFEAVERAGLTFLKPIIERDVMGNDRPWQADRGREDPVERKRWLAIAFLTLPNFQEKLST